MDRNSRSPSSLNLSECDKPFSSRGGAVVLDVIREEDLIVEYLTDEMIARRVPGVGNLRAKVGRSDHLAMLVSNAEIT